MRRRQLAALRRDLNQESLVTDSLAEHLERRVAAIEAVFATPWPRSIAARARFGRQLRRSVRHFPGRSFAERREAAATADWLVKS